MKTLLCSSFVVLACCTAASAQPLPFFSGAEGYGGSFLGAAPAAGWFSTATVYRVTNLNDSGPGSLRGAFQENSSNRIIIFDVGGTIVLNDSLDIKNLSNYYIAGQTAPSPITIYGDTTQLTHSSNKTNSNVILRYLTFRKGTGDGSDSITFAGGGLGSHLILDHVSASWSEDEILSVANNNTNVTVQYSIISDALVNNHAYGSLIRPRISSNVSFHHNLYAHNASRQARFGTYNGELLTADFRNNVVYNWRDRASYAGGSSESNREFVDLNYVGNYFIAGPGTTSNATRAMIVDRNVDVRAYQAGNFIDSDRQVNPGGEPNGADTGWGMWQISSTSNIGTLQQMANPFNTPAVTTQSAIDAYWQLINHVGNFWWDRDAIDARVINNVLTNTGPTIGAAAPIAGELNGVLNATMTTHPAGWDTDGDGMPDVWEVAHGLNPNNPNDWNLDFDDDGYINLIEYINERGEFPAPAPIVFNGATSNRYAVITNWKTDDGGVTTGSFWQPSKYDEARINSGTVVVDAAGQHARLLKLANQAGNNATLNITGGWLNVVEELVIGAQGSGVAALNLSGGTLKVVRLSKGAGGTFSFIGGTLHAEEVEFDLVNQGGTLAPGHSPGTMHVTGNLTLQSGVLEIEVAGGGLSDVVQVDGEAVLGGTLAVLPLGGYNAQAGDSFTFLTADSVAGTFSDVQLPDLPGDLAFLLDYQADSVALRVLNLVPGDFNLDGQVTNTDIQAMLDALVDLSGYQSAHGLTDDGLRAIGDINGSGSVTNADIQSLLDLLTTGDTQSIPEPAGAALLSLLPLALLRAGRR